MRYAKQKLPEGFICLTVSWRKSLNKAQVIFCILHKFIKHSINYSKLKWRRPWYSRKKVKHIVTLILYLETNLLRYSRRISRLINYLTLKETCLIQTAKSTGCKENILLIPTVINRLYRSYEKRIHFIK